MGCSWGLGHINAEFPCVNTTSRGNLAILDYQLEARQHAPWYLKHHQTPVCGHPVGYPHWIREPKSIGQEVRINLKNRHSKSFLCVVVMLDLLSGVSLPSKPEIMTNFQPGMFCTTLCLCTFQVTLSVSLLFPWCNCFSSLLLPRTAHEEAF